MKYSLMFVVLAHVSALVWMALNILNAVGGVR